MFARLALAFIVIPIIELALLMMLADATNWKVSLVLVILTGLTGAWVVRHQGWRALRRVQTELRAGKLPGDALLDGVLILAAGLLLLTPGLLTDLTAIALVVPWTRARVKQRLIRWFRTHVSVHAVVGGADNFRPDAAQAGTGETFEAQARRVD